MNTDEEPPAEVKPLAAECDGGLLNKPNHDWRQAIRANNPTEAEELELIEAKNPLNDWRSLRALAHRRTNQ